MSFYSLFNARERKSVECQKKRSATVPNGYAVWVCLRLSFTKVRGCLKEWDRMLGERTNKAARIGKLLEGFVLINDFMVCFSLFWLNVRVCVCVCVCVCAAVW